MGLKTIIFLMRISLGIIFLWFGTLKLFEGLSPAETLATQTITILSFGYIPPYISIKLLAIWELLIGIGFITGYRLQTTLWLFFIHMFGTFTPLVILPETTFTQAPYAFTIVGQYIMKNIIFVLVGITIFLSEKNTNLGSEVK